MLATKVTRVGNKNNFNFIPDRTTMQRVRYSKLYIPLAFGEVSVTRLGLPLCFISYFTFLPFCKLGKQDMIQLNNFHSRTANGRGLALWEDHVEKVNSDLFSLANRSSPASLSTSVAYFCVMGNNELE